MVGPVRVEVAPWVVTRGEPGDAVDVAGRRGLELCDGHVAGHQPEGGERDGGGLGIAAGGGEGDAARGDLGESERGRFGGSRDAECGDGLVDLGGGTPQQVVVLGAGHLQVPRATDGAGQGQAVGGWDVGVLAAVQHQGGHPDGVGLVEGVPPIPHHELHGEPGVLVLAHLPDVGEGGLQHERSGPHLLGVPEEGGQSHGHAASQALAVDHDVLGPVAPPGFLPGGDGVLHEALFVGAAFASRVAPVAEVEHGEAGVEEGLVAAGLAADARAVAAEEEQQGVARITDAPGVELCSVLGVELDDAGVVVAGLVREGLVVDQGCRVHQRGLAQHHAHADQQVDRYGEGEHEQRALHGEASERRAVRLWA